jgi:membrane protease YdiL (CAAX protease family)
MTRPDGLPRLPRTRVAQRGLVWTAWTVAALLLLPFVGGAVYGVVVTASALVVCAVPGALPPRSRTGDRRDLLAIAGLYVVVVALLSLAFRVFTTDRVLGMFLAFAATLLVGTVGPVVWTVWVSGRPLGDLGLGVGTWRRTAGLAVLFAGVQGALTLWGYDLPAPVDWVPLLVMALVVGIFESVFFRGFVQGRLEEQLGTGPGVGVAAGLYGAYHVGYGMGGADLAFLTALGVVYAVAYALTRSVLVLWPLLTPLGSFYANLEAGDIDLPWASIAGFADVAAVMAVAGWLAVRHQRRVQIPPPGVKTR